MIMISAISVPLLSLLGWNVDADCDWLTGYQILYSQFHSVNACMNYADSVTRDGQSG